MISRFSSRASQWKARTTRTPVRFSSSTALIRSSSFCSRRNRGAAPLMMKKAMSRMAPTTPSRMKPMAVSRAKVSPRATAQMAGTGTIICRVAVRANWMVVMSEMVRVVMEAVPNCRKSYTDRVRDLA